MLRQVMIDHADISPAQTWSSEQEALQSHALFGQVSCRAHMAHVIQSRSILALAFRHKSSAAASRRLLRRTSFLDRYFYCFACVLGGGGRGGRGGEFHCFLASLHPGFPLFLLAALPFAFLVSYHRPPTSAVHSLVTSAPALSHASVQNVSF